MEGEGKVEVVCLRLLFDSTPNRSRDHLALLMLFGSTHDTCITMHLNFATIHRVFPKWQIVFVLES